MWFFLLALFALVGGVRSNSIEIYPQGDSNDSNGCVTFSVGGGTGCDWMCNYCSNQLGTTNYYFTSDVCTYETGGCVGSPSAGVQYTCCSVSEEEEVFEIFELDEE
jgi:hypothetical protein